jgi:hypothetical protein
MSDHRDQIIAKRNAAANLLPVKARRPDEWIVEVHYIGGVRASDRHSAVTCKSALELMGAALADPEVGGVVTYRPLVETRADEVTGHAV